jgi:putative membrane protein
VAAEVDATRRTRLANERTFLAWWRTGVTSLLVSLGVGRLLPQLTDTNETLSIVIGACFAILGGVTMGYGWLRHRDLELALAKGQFVEPDARFILAISASGVVLALLTLVLVVGSG